MLAICTAVALFSGDCVWGMEEDESRENLLQQSQRSREQKIRQIASKGIQKAKNLFKRKKFQTQATQTNQTTDSIPIEQIPINSRQVEENMDRLVKHEPDHYNLFHYEKMQNSAADEGFSTPTELVTYPDGNPKIWSDISEIRYANDLSCDKLENPKVILYRNKDNSCYIILRIQENKHGVFYGINESHIELGGKSFSVYDVSKDVGSFTDGVERLIYVDESGLYFVPANENPVEDVIKTYQNEGKFDFEGSVIKVSAIDGTITWNGNAITEDNFFDNWVKEEREVEKYVSIGSANTFGANKFGVVVQKEKQIRSVLSTKKRNKREIIRNFYPPSGYYDGIFEFLFTDIEGHRCMECLNAYGVPKKNASGKITIDLKDRNWFNSFINNRLQIAGIFANAKSGAEELIKDGTFSSILSKDSDFYSQKVRDAIAAQLMTKGRQTTSSWGGKLPAPISEMVERNQALFKDPEFVRSLKPAFKELEKDYEHNKESEMWIPFEIVRNL